MKNILITGSTGVVGNAVLQKLLHSEQNIVYLLIRSTDKASLESKVQKLGIDLKNINLNTFILNGDISKENLGLSPNDYQSLQSKLDVIVHSAASVILNQPLNIARENALQGTRHVLDLAGKCKKLINLSYISTVGVIGKSPTILLENPAPENVEYHNSYEQAKAEAEFYVLKTTELLSLPTIIYRPSMIVGDSLTGSIRSKQIFYYILDFMINGGVMHLMPELSGFDLDTIPINYLTDCICQNLETAKKGTPQLYNTCSGHENAINLGTLKTILYDELRAEGKRISKSQTLSVPNFQKLMKFLSVLPIKSIKKKINSLSHLICYLENSPRFSNTLFAENMKKNGVEILKPDQYLKAVIREYLKS